MNPKMREFENDTFLHDELRRIVAKYKVTVICESGTEYGGSANAFARMPSVVHVITMDIEKKFDQGDMLHSVTFLLGDSRKQLKTAIAMANGIDSRSPILFFLDAHSSIATDECPLRGELQVILDARLLAVPPILVIHDCVVPGKDFGFDTYRDGPICWEGVSDLVAKIYPEGYVKSYNDKAAGSKRGCLFVEPFDYSPRWVPTPEERARMEQ